MNPFLVQRTQLLPITQENAWDFFSDPRNLPAITPPDLGFKITSAVPERMYAGMVVNYTVTPFPGIRVDWTTEITHVREYEFFVDEQRFGPYRFWHHQHFFQRVRGGTEMTDSIHYLLPFQPFGQLAASFVRKKLDRIFDFRRQVLEKLFCG
jgi:ligand-binding SRPBCC domain-containing protein